MRPVRGSLVAVVVLVACTTTSTTVPASSPASSTPPSSAGPSGPAGGRWPTYHGDVTRSGVAAGPSLAGVRHAWTSPQLDATVYAEPLAIGARVITATENDTVYALDAETGTVAWQRHLGTPVDSASLPCGNIVPTSGITATPVADPGGGLLYVAAFLAPAQHELFALRTSNGAVLWHRPIDPPGMDPRTQQLRSALALANGSVYVAYGGLFGDCGSYHGWVAALAADGSGPLLDYRVPTTNAGGIWAPSGPAVDRDGNLFVATGNSFSADTFDLGDSVIELSPQLKELRFFAPEDWAALNTGDVDLGSVGPTLLPGGRVFQIGKGGVGYLLDANDLGGIGGELSSAPVCGGSFGGTAHDGRSIYVPCSDGLVAVRVADDGRSFDEVWHSAAFDAGPPIVAGGLVWSIDLSSSALLGFDPAGGSEVVRRADGRGVALREPLVGSGVLVRADVPLHHRVLRRGGLTGDGSLAAFGPTQRRDPALPRAGRAPRGSPRPSRRSVLREEGRRILVGAEGGGRSG